MTINIVRGGSEMVRAIEALGIDPKTTRRVVIDLQTGAFPEVAVYRTASDEDLATLIERLPQVEVRDLE